MGIWAHNVAANDQTADYTDELVEKLVTDLEDAIEKDRTQLVFSLIAILRGIGFALEYSHIPVPASRWALLRDYFLEDAKGWEQRTLRIQEVKRVFDIPCYEPSDSEYEEFYKDEE